MSRPLRIEYPGAWYHVMNWGRRANDIFTGKRDYPCFVDLLQETSEMWSVCIAAYCLMPNHYHLLAQTSLANLSRSMRHVNGIYTQRYNRRHGCDGQLFRGRYKAQFYSSKIDDEVPQAKDLVKDNINQIRAIIKKSQGQT